MTNGDSLDDNILKPYHGIRWLENQGDVPVYRASARQMLRGPRAQAVDLDGDGDLDIVACSLVPNDEVDTAPPAVGCLARTDASREFRTARARNRHRPGMRRSMPETSTTMETSTSSSATSTRPAGNCRDIREPPGTAEEPCCPAQTARARTHAAAGVECRYERHAFDRDGGSARVNRGPDDEPHYIHRRVSRLCDVPDAGRGDAPVDAPPGLPREPLLGARGVQHDPRAVAGVLAARSDPAGVFVPRRRIAAVLDRQPTRQGRELRPNARPCGRRSVVADPARHLPPLARAPDGPTGRSRTR